MSRAFGYAGGYGAYNEFQQKQEVEDKPVEAAWSERLLAALEAHAKDLIDQTKVLELGRAYLELSRYDDAAYVSQKASGSPAEVLKADIFLGKGDHALASQIYRSLVQDEASAEHILGLARARLAGNKFHQVLNAVERILVTDPDHPTAQELYCHALRGIAEKDGEKLTEEIEYVLKLDLQPGVPDVLSPLLCRNEMWTEVLEMKPKFTGVEGMASLGFAAVHTRNQTIATDVTKYLKNAMTTQTDLAGRKRVHVCTSLASLALQFGPRDDVARYVNLGTTTTQEAGLDMSPELNSLLAEAPHCRYTSRYQYDRYDRHKYGNEQVDRSKPATPPRNAARRSTATWTFGLATIVYLLVYVQEYIMEGIPEDLDQMNTRLTKMMMNPLVWTGMGLYMTSMLC
jgi:tetratricopeptide (TPR) repeat protein